MDTAKFTENQMQHIKKYLNSVERNRCCDNPKVQIANEMFSLPTMTNEVPAPGMDIFVTVCHNCSKVEMYNLSIAKIPTE